MVETRKWGESCQNSFAWWFKYAFPQIYPSCSLNSNLLPKWPNKSLLCSFMTVFFRTFHLQIYAVVIRCAYMCNNRGGWGKERSKYTNTIMYLFSQNVYLQLRNGKKWDFPHFQMGLLGNFSGKRSGTSWIWNLLEALFMWPWNKGQR